MRRARRFATASVSTSSGRSGVFVLISMANSNGTRERRRRHAWLGSGTSPVLHKDLLIVNAAVESKSLIALDKNTGKEKWQVKGLTESWNTPCLAKGRRRIELAVAANRKMLGYDPDTGKELWSADVYDWYVCPSIIAHEGVFYGLQHSICTAVKGGGKGDVTSSHVLWHKNFGAVVAHRRSIMTAISTGLPTASPFA